MPILLPLLTSAIMLLTSERQRTAKNVVSIATILAVLVIDIILLLRIVAVGLEGAPATRAYLIGDWPAPFGIVLVSDWLSALMLILAATLALAAMIYATARWERVGPRFHALFLLQLMGLNGAFLTGDIFNLFVFFEVLLAASYGLLLHGSGEKRVKAGLHYVSVNVLASLLFLIGTAMIYGVTGTLNMADLAYRIATVPARDIALLQSGMAILGIAFLIKAGMWPLSFWLPRTYAAASPPAAALFAILSKVGIYAVLRIYLLLFGEEGGWAINFGEEWLLIGGIATLAFGTIGVLAARSLAGVAGYSVLISSGSLLGVIGAGRGQVLGGALYYLVSSTLALAAFYLLMELVERADARTVDLIDGEPVFDDEETEVRVLEQEESEIGTRIPATIAVLGGGFVFSVLLMAGLPPLSGFLAKFAMIDGLLDLSENIAATSWWLIGLLIVSGLAILISTTRAGIDLLWTPDVNKPPLRVSEAAPVGILLGVCLGLTIFAGPVMRYMERTAISLYDREGYIQAVLKVLPDKDRAST
ncbi:monovalent cation/H+ antiporter subunit D [Altererythrobacter aerius]|uniref:Monovalent cation/H+ antiporter subunit D n=2 Tax=Tsuneonella aeria TaxID=1837929 RepID=A0A6I4TFV1_9SPHN|nr:monovalent cation/H+ antiporter subunit D [Tsuneonella aeria]